MTSNPVSVIAIKKTPVLVFPIKTNVNVGPQFVSAQEINYVFVISIVNSQLQGMRLFMR